MFRKILVGIDGSDTAHKAVDVAIDLARQYHSSLCLLHAFPHVSEYLGSPTYEHQIQQSTMHGRELLDQIYEEINGTVPVETQLLEGPPASAILRVAEAEGYDLIVVGSRGNNQFVSLLMGSVSTAVTQKAHCPVMVIH